MKQFEFSLQPTRVFSYLMALPFLGHAEIQSNSELLSFLSWSKLNQGSLSSIEDRSDASFYMSGNFKYIRSHFSAEVRPEVRTLFSNSLDLESSDPALASVEPPPRYFKWYNSLNNENKPDIYTDLDKLIVSYSTDTLELYLGRKEIGLGLVPYLSVWNKFDTVLPTTIRADKPLTHDGFGSTWQKQNLSLRLIGLLGSTPQKDAYLGIGSWYSQRSGLEVHFLAGTLWEESAFGNALAFDWHGWSFRAEILWLGQTNLKNESGFQGSASAEYSFAKVWNVDLEYLNIESRLNGDNTVSKFSPLIGKNYAFAIISRSIFETMKIFVGSLYSLTDKSILGLMKFRYSFSDYGDAQLEIKSPFGSPLTELSDKRVLLPDGTYAGFPLFASLSVKFVF
ncbi:MAG: hypothetical protein IPJ84_14715 [Bdellovibrionales bacterium]|nr:hypothetical protein [Bdellovibrionales bacterium]